MEMKISSAKELRDSIIFLEEKKRQQEKALHDQLEETYDSLKSINLIKSALHNVLGINEQNPLLPSVAGLVGSVVVKKIIPGSSGNIIKKVLGASLGWALSNWVLRKTKKQS